MKCPECGSENTEGARFCNNCAAPLDQNAPIETDQVSQLGDEHAEFANALSGKYEIVREIGRGGMAVVYEARELSLDRTVALKVLPKELTYDKQFVDRFKREIKTLAGITHPSIVPLHSAGESGGYSYFSMMKIEGKTIADLIKERGKFTPEETIRIAKEVASGLEYAHENEVLHRDLKPENIMLDKRGHIYVMDFGIAKALSGTRVTKTGMAVGSVHYMSPEQCSGGEIDARSDLYSLGVIMYEMLTGEVPFDGEPTAVMYKHVHEDPPDIRRTGPGLPGGVVSVVESLLAKDKESRPGDAGELVKVLTGEKPVKMAIRTEKAPEAPAAKAAKPPLEKSVDGGKILKIAGAVLGALVVAGGIAWWAMRPEGNVRLLSDPPGAVVYDDKGNEIGDTPLWLDLEAGKYNFILKKKDYKDYKHQLAILEPEKKYNPTLTLIKNNIYIKTEPEGAIILNKNNKSIGETPLSFWKEKGDYIYKITKDGYRDEIVRVNLKDDRETLTFNKKLKQYTQIILKTKPTGVTVIDNNTKEKSVTPVTIKRIEGVYIFTLKKNGYHTEEFSVKIGSNGGEIVKDIKLMTNSEYKRWILVDYKKHNVLRHHQMWMIKINNLYWDFIPKKIKGWSEAREYCSNRRMRLPKLNELEKAIESGNKYMLTPDGKYWSRTLKSLGGDVFIVSIDGKVKPVSRETVNYARCVCEN